MGTSDLSLNLLTYTSRSLDLEPLFALSVFFKGFINYQYKEKLRLETRQIYINQQADEDKETFCVLERFY